MVEPRYFVLPEVVHHIENKYYHLFLTPFLRVIKRHKNIEALPIRAEPLCLSILFPYLLRLSLKSLTAALQSWSIVLDSSIRRPMPLP